MASPVLPTFFSLKSKMTNRNSLYLQYIDQYFDGVHGLLKFSGEDVVSPYTKFQAEEAHVIDNDYPNLVHIRSCYNNKYLVRAHQNQRWIVAGADEPQQNRSDRLSTLFQVNIIESSIGVKIKVRHLESLTYLKISRINECLFLSPDSQNFDAFTVIDWNSFVILPKHLAFKGDNGNYSTVRSEDPYLLFSGNYPTHETTENEVFPAGDGSVCIYSTHKQNFWRCNDSNWILVERNDDVVRPLSPEVDFNARFRPVKVNVDPDVDDVNDVVVTLLNLRTNHKCKRLPWDNAPEGRLNAGNVGNVNNSSQQEQLAVEELVTSRTISILNFHALTDARIYNRNIDKIVATGFVENKDQQPASKYIWLYYEDTKVSTWNTSTEDLAFTAIIPTTLTSDTPFILGENRIDISGKFDGPYQWGQPHRSSTLIKLRVRVDVPAFSSVTVTLRATEASCDIPFNYSKKDTHAVHPIIPHYNEEVGLYTGVSLYNFHHTTQEERLPADEE